MRMRSLFASVVVLAVSVGCSHAGGPAWPKQHARDTDGGESLAPHEARAVAAVEASPDDKSSATADTDTKPAKATTPGTPIGPPATPSTPPTEEVPVQTEEVIIEIDGSE